jgi:iron complex transport system substrate-binding protein
VLLDSVQTKFATQLNNLAIKVFPLPMQTVSDVRSALRTVGDALGRGARAGQVIAALDARLDAETGRAEAAAGRAVRRLRVLFVIDRRPGGLSGMVAAGPGTYIDDLLRRAGVLNCLADAGATYVQLPAEEVIRRGPDIIFDAAHDAGDKGLADWAPLASVPAVAAGRVYLLQSPVYVTPGPRLAEALAGLVDLIWHNP